MIAMDDRRGRKPPFFPSDPWSGWQPEWDEAAGPHRLQERHSPTDRTSHGARQRMVDARLWGAMSATQKEAAVQIVASYETMNRGMGYVQSNWERIPGARGQGNVAEAHMRLIGTYVDWTKLCHREKVSHSSILDILIFGLSLGECDKKRRVRKGWARKNLLEGLSLYCRMRGWPV